MGNCCAAPKNNKTVHATRSWDHYVSHNVYWVTTADVRDNIRGETLFPHNARVPCVFVEVLPTGARHLIDVDASVERDGVSYTASRKVIGVTYGVRIGVSLLRRHNERVEAWTLEGEAVPLDTVGKASSVVAARKWLAPIDV